VDGNGTWEFDPEDGRIMLTLAEVSDPACDVPYLTQVWARSGPSIRAEPEVDEPTRYIEYVKQTNQSRGR
jgi:hypothetical protein